MTVPARGYGSEIAFESRRVELLAKLSSEILSDPLSRKYPDLITFAYFARRQNLLAYIQPHQVRGGGLHYGVGTVVHVAPSNIPLNFAYSWVYSFITGSSSYVRLPTIETPQSNLFLSQLQSLFELKEFKDDSSRNLFFQCERESLEFKAILRQADALLVWGGDKTVASIRHSELRPWARFLPFPDRKSSLVVKSSDLLVGGKSLDLRVLGGALFNDTYLVDANACSSPTTWIFVGSSSENEEALALISRALDLAVREKEYSPPIVARLLDSLQDAEWSGKVEPLRMLGDFSKALFGTQSESGRLLRYGVFRIQNVQSIEDIPSLLRDNEQTLTYLGLTRTDCQFLRDLCVAEGLPVTRLVPVGSAIDLDFFWEGQDIPMLLTRRVSIE